MRSSSAPVALACALVTLVSCEPGGVELEQLCTCGREIAQVAADCLAAVAAAEAAALAREQEVADNAAADLQEQTDWTNTRIRDTSGILADQIAAVRTDTDALRDQLADLRRRVEVLEVAP